MVFIVISVLRNFIIHSTGVGNVPETGRYRLSHYYLSLWVVVPEFAKVFTTDRTN